MKKNQLFRASSSFLGIALMLSLCGTLVLASLDAMTDFYAVCKCQWMAFSEQFSMIQPHRTVFPH